MALIQPVILVGNNIVPAGTGQYIDPTSLGSGSPTSSTFLTGANTWVTIPYDIVGGASSLLTSGEKILNFVAVRPFSLAANVSGSYCVAITAPTSTAVFYLNKNGSSFGSMLFPSASTSATFSSTATSFLIGDILSVEAPSPADSTLANVGFTLMGIV